MGSEIKIEYLGMLMGILELLGKINWKSNLSDSLMHVWLVNFILQIEGLRGFRNQNRGHIYDQHNF